MGKAGCLDGAEPFHKPAQEPAKEGSIYPLHNISMEDSKKQTTPEDGPGRAHHVTESSKNDAPHKDFFHNGSQYSHTQKLQDQTSRHEHGTGFLIGARQLRQRADIDQVIAHHGKSDARHADPQDTVSIHPLRRTDLPVFQPFFTVCPV